MFPTSAIHMLRRTNRQMAAHAQYFNCKVSHVCKIQMGEIGK